jgi:ribonucleoside-diphosphate reductase alpha chain
VWDECVDSGRHFGYRNAQATVLAPTGTIAFMMDCDTTGIEPDIALVKYKQLAGGGMMKIVNRTVPLALKSLGYDSPEVERIVKYIEDRETIEGAPDLKAENVSVFDCAFKAANGTRSIPWKAHVRMMAAAQPFLSGAISKTVNMPSDTTVEDIEKAYFEGWRLGLKALAIYRDGSKQSQPLSTTKEGDRKKGSGGDRPARRRLPATRQSLTHKFSVGGHEGYITVGLFEDGTPGELFINMAKEGSTIGGLMDVIGTETSMGLQYGVPLEVLVEKFSHTRFEPSGWTPNQDIPVAKSLVDYIFRWLGIQFIPGFREANTPKRDLPVTHDDDPDESHPVAEVVAKPVPATSASQVNGNGSSNGHTSNGHSGNGHASNGHTGNGHASGNGKVPAAVAQRLVTVKMVQSLAGSLELTANRNQQFAKFQSDAPSCGNCGAITVRNGNCYLCHNCGTSHGCS